jgi:hypothetical protein
MTAEMRPQEACAEPGNGKYRLADAFHEDLEPDFDGDWAVLCRHDFVNCDCKLKFPP